MKKTYAYIRVSSLDQNESRQIDALGGLGIPPGHIFLDKQSGKDFQRPAYRRLLKRLHPGDLVILKSIDRLGRNYAEIIEQWQFITRKLGADIRVLDMPLLDTTYAKDLLGTFVSDLILQILSFTAQMERDNIRQRQREGIDSARKRGVRFGRPEKHLPENFDALLIKWRNRELTNEQLEAACGMTLSVIYRKMRENHIRLLPYECP